MVRVPGIREYASITDGVKWTEDLSKSTMIDFINNTEPSLNKRLMNYFKRSGMGVPKARNPDRMFYNGVNEVPFSVNIQHTQQWVLYHKIDEKYEPNWEKIAWNIT